MSSTHTHETNVEQMEIQLKHQFPPSLNPLFQISCTKQVKATFLCLCTTYHMEHYFYKLCGAPIPARGWYSAGQETPWFMNPNVHYPLTTSAIKPNPEPVAFTQSLHGTFLVIQLYYVVTYLQASQIVSSCQMFCSIIYVQFPDQ